MPTLEHAISAAYDAQWQSPAPSLRRAGAVAVAAAAAANAALYAAGARLDLFPQSVLVPGANAPITLARVVAVTAVCVGVGVATLALIRRRVTRPYATFRVVALVALLLSFTQPSLVLRDAPLRMVLALNALHVAAAAIALLALRRTTGAGGGDG